MLNSKNRAKLRGMANTMNPVFQIGKEGIDTPLTESVLQCLNARELIKVKCLETCPHTPREAAEELAQATKAEVVQVIGRVIVLYKQKKKESAYAKLLT